MLSTKTCVQLGLVAAALVLLSSRSSAQNLSCSSDDGRRHYCPADTRGGVQLVKQRSDSPCRQGYSWGFDRGGVWVDRGCRAEFPLRPYQYWTPYRGGGRAAPCASSCSPDGARSLACASQTRRGHWRVALR